MVRLYIVCSSIHLALSPDPWARFSRCPTAYIGSIFFVTRSLENGSFWAEDPFQPGKGQAIWPDYFSDKSMDSTGELWSVLAVVERPGTRRPLHREKHGQLDLQLDSEDMRARAQRWLSKPMEP